MVNQSNECGHPERKHYSKGICQKCYQAAYRAEHKEEMAVYRAEHKEERRTYFTARKAAQRRRALEHYGDKCACCGESRPEFLAFDHINNDGAHQRQRLGGYGRGQIAWWLIKHNFPDNIQILCHNCNSAKSFYGECPHVKEACQ